MARSFEDLQIWNISHQLTLRIYQLTAMWPPEEIFTLTSQIRRAALSVELNIAEGHSRHYWKEISHFMYNARTSAEEVRNCLMVARDLERFSLNSIEFDELNQAYIGLSKGINGFINAQRRDRSNSLVS